MQKLLSLLGILCISLLIQGCSTGSSSTDYGSTKMQKQIENKRIAEEGLASRQTIPPLPPDWQNLARDAIKKELISPQTSRFVFSVTPRYCSFSNTSTVSKFIRRHTTDTPVLGYCGIASVTAQNAFGSYTKYQFFFILSGDAVSIVSKNGENTWISLEELSEQILWDSNECLLIR